jgi:hypothetical protein
MFSIHIIDKVELNVRTSSTMNTAVTKDKTACKRAKKPLGKPSWPLSACKFKKRSVSCIGATLAAGIYFNLMK